VLSAERSLDEQVAPGAAVPSTVTLLVTAQDASKIQLASTTGSLSLSLRGDEDTTGSSGGGTVTVDDLYGGNTRQGSRRSNREGTVSIGGKRFFVENGRLIPAEDALE
jgi:Flp pilus assembly protein CpaB